MRKSQQKPQKNKKKKVCNGEFGDPIRFSRGGKKLGKTQRREGGENEEAVGKKKEREKRRENTRDSKLRTGRKKNEALERWAWFRGSRSGLFPAGRPGTCHFLVWIMMSWAVLEFDPLVLPERNPGRSD